MTGADLPTLVQKTARETKCAEGGWRVHWIIPFRTWCFLEPGNATENAIRRILERLGLALKPGPNLFVDSNDWRHNLSLCYTVTVPLKAPLRKGGCPELRERWTTGVRLFAKGKARFCADGDPSFSVEVNDAFNKAARLLAYRDEDVFASALHQAGVPQAAIEEYLRTYNVEDGAYFDRSQN